MYVETKLYHLVPRTYLMVCADKCLLHDSNVQVKNCEIDSNHSNYAAHSCMYEFGSYSSCVEHHFGHVDDESRFEILLISLLILKHLKAI